MSINPNINPNDLVNRLTQKGAKQVASTFGAMYQKTTEKQKAEKEAQDITKQYQIVDQHSQTKELDKNAKHAGLISQSLTDKEIGEEEDAVMLDEELLLEEGAKEQGLLTKQENVVTEEEQVAIEEAEYSQSAVREKRSIFTEIASKVGTTPEEIEKAALEEVETQLKTNKAEMTQLKFPSETAAMETEIYYDSKPATLEIKEEKLIIMDNSPLDPEIAEKEF